MTNGFKMAVFAVTTAMVPVAQGQYTGVSRPEQVPVTTSPETVQQTVVLQPTAPTNGMQTNGAVAQATPGYVPTPAANDMKLKVRPADGMVVGGGGYGTAPAAVASVREDGGFVNGGDPDGMIVTRIEGPANELPVGTLIKVRMQEGLSTMETAVGQPFHGELTEAVERDGRVLLPAGAVLSGRVTDVHGGKRITGAASIHLQPMEITMPDGQKYRIAAQVADTDHYHATKVDEEGTIVRKDHAGKTLAAMGLVTGAGIATGAVVAGVPGAVVGGLVGAGVGTAVWLKQDRQMALPAGTKVVFSLDRALVVGVE